MYAEHPPADVSQAAANPARFSVQSRSLCAPQRWWSDQPRCLPCAVAACRAPLLPAGCSFNNTVKNNQSHQFGYIRHIMSMLFQSRGGNLSLWEPLEMPCTRETSTSRSRRCHRQRGAPAPPQSDGRSVAATRTAQVTSAFGRRTGRRRASLLFALETVLGLQAGCRNPQLRQALLLWALCIIS